MVLNLVKSAEKRPRETILRQEYANAISYINNQARHLPFWSFGDILQRTGALVFIYILQCCFLGDNNREDKLE